MILKIGQGTFNVRLSIRLVLAWLWWGLHPTYENLNKLSAEICRRRIKP